MFGKKIMIAAVALSISGAAAAQSSVEVRNQGNSQQIVVDQSQALDSRVSAFQIGSNNQASITQRDEANDVVLDVKGNQQDHSIEQSGFAENDLRLDASGSSHQTIITQDGGAGGSNIADVTMNGSDNMLMLDQFADPGPPNSVVALQSGHGNMAILSQAGSDNSLSLSQHGNDNFADLAQDGHGLTLGVTQNGGASISIYQTDN